MNRPPGSVVHPQRHPMGKPETREQIPSLAILLGDSISCSPGWSRMDYTVEAGLELLTPWPSTGVTNLCHKDLSVLAALTVSTNSGDCSVVCDSPGDINCYTFCSN